MPAGVYQPKNWFLYFVGGVFYLCAFRMIINGLRGSYHKFKHKRIKSKISKTYRPAQFATLRDLKKKGLLKPSLNALIMGSLQGRPIFYSGKGHPLTIAKPRTGKTTSCAINAVMHNTNTSMFISDPKGEIAATTLEHRQKFSDCYVINPFNLFPEILPNHRFNPFMTFIEDLCPERINYLKFDIEETALQLIPEPGDNGTGGDDKNKYFRDNGREILSAIILGLTLLRDPRKCTLNNALSILLSQDRFLDLLAQMAVMEYFSGAVQDIAESMVNLMSNKKTDLWFNFISYPKNRLNVFSPIGPIADSTSCSDFRLEQLKEGTTTYYLCCPGRFAEVLSPWLGLIIKSGINAVTRAQTSTPVLFILDEFNTFKLPHITNYLNLLPGYGVRCWMMAHGISAIRKTYGNDDLETLLASSEVLQVFGNTSDSKFANEISNALGNMTVKTQSSHVDDLQQTVSYNYAENQHPMITQNELRMLDDDEQIIIQKNLPPIRCSRVSCFDIKPFRSWLSKNPMEKGPLPKINPKTKLVLKYS